MVRFTCITFGSVIANVYPAPSGRDYQFHKGQWTIVNVPIDVAFFDSKPEQFQRHKEDKKIKVKIPKPKISITKEFIDDYLDQNAKTVLKNINKDNLDEKTLDELFKAEEAGKKRKGIITKLKKLLKR